jgi:ribosome biogenesis GTPase
MKGLKTTNPVAVGDFVMVKIQPDNNAVITHIEERKNYIIRRSTNQSKVFHVIASNIDQAILLITLAMPRTSTGFIDRFLVTAEAYQIPTTLVFNKLDLYSEQLLHDYQAVRKTYESCGYSCLGVSALRGDNLPAFRELLKGRTSLVSGHSGVGKSALLNAAEPSLDLRTAAISTVHNKGKHTTTYAEMHPLSFGGYVIDTPGIKEFGLIDFHKDELTHYFPEMFALLSECQFYNCTHHHEPGCAVKQGLINGSISLSRYQNYISMLTGEDLAINSWEIT